MKKEKELTAPSLLKLSKEFSLYSGQYKEVFTQHDSQPLYESKMVNESGDEIVVICSYPLSAKDGMLSDFLLNRWSRYSRKGADGKGELDIEKNVFNVKVTDILDDLSLTDRTENRSYLLEMVNHIRAINIVGNTGAIVYNFSIFAGIVYNQQEDEFQVEVSKTFISLFATAKMRYINIESLKDFKSDYTRELWRLLQAEGQGVDKSTGKGRGTKNISKAKIIEYLNIQDKPYKIATQIIRRAFDEIKKIVGIEYKFSRKKQSFEQSNFVAVGGRKKSTPNTHIKAQNKPTEDFKDDTIIDVKEELKELNEASTGTPKIEVYKGLNDKYILPLSDGSTEELGYEIDTDIYTVIPNPCKEKKDLDF